jgi:hypothetical protein
MRVKMVVLHPSGHLKSTEISGVGIKPYVRTVYTIITKTIKKSWYVIYVGAVTSDHPPYIAGLHYS